MLDIAPATFERIAAIAQRRWGIHLTERKRSLVAHRLGSHLHDHSQFPSVDAYVQHLERSADEADMLVFFDLLSTNVTSFFRDPQHFHLLEREFWTPLLRGAFPSRGRRVRLWSAACSIGCEPYSMAIQALESLGDARDWDVRVLATDLSTTALDAARSGEYTEPMVEPIDPSLRDRHFERVIDHHEPIWRIGERARALVTVRRLNLIEAWPFQGPFDVIFARNVMIYFDPATRQALVQRLASYLRPGGFLVVGSAETLSGLDVSLRPLSSSVYMA